eukprot:COSAG03_NODE_12665_length_536_cov_25.491991_1_plen_117_part_10
MYVGWYRIGEFKSIQNWYGVPIQNRCESNKLWSLVPTGRVSGASHVAPLSTAWLDLLSYLRRRVRYSKRYACASSGEAHRAQPPRCGAALTCAFGAFQAASALLWGSRAAAGSWALR